MANYNRLKDAIITVIKTNGNNEITGVLLQQVLLAMIGSLGTGYQFAGILTSETVLGQSDKRLFYIAPPGEYDNNFVVPSGCLGLVYGSAEWEMAVLNILAVVNDLVTGGTNAALSAEQGKVLKTMLEEAIGNITALIPSQATPQNQLADKAFVNSSIATNTANYISDNGQPFQSLADLLAYSGILTNNDYAFVVGTDASGNTTYTRYKYSARTDEWAAEYVLNNSSFTAAQWAAISSGITAALVQKLSELPVEVVTYTAQTLTAAQKQQAQANLGLQSVLKYTEQTLTDEQKLQVLANLGLQNVLRYAEQSLTDAQKQQARQNIGATAPEVFLAEYGVTTAEEIRGAIAANKICILVYLGRTFYFSGDLVGSASYNFLWFMCMQNDQSWYARVRTDTNQWSSNYTNLERASNKSQSVETDKASTTKYPSTKAVADAIAAGKQIFWATYGTTTAAEIDQAVADGKAVLCNYNNRIYQFTAKTATGAYTFNSIDADIVYRLAISISGNWSNTFFRIQQTSEKSQSIETDRTSTTKYPSVKAVFDSLGKWGVVSQTQTWTGNNNTGYDYTMSNQVWGMIPQANIDLFSDVGAIFNDTGEDIVRQDPFGYDVTHKAGCFYLPGIGDISYKEMITIYECRWSVPQTPVGGVPAVRVFESTRARYGLVTYGHNWNSGINLYMLAPYNTSNPLSVLCLSNTNEVYVGAARQMLLNVPRIKAIYPVLNLQNLTGTGSAYNTFYGAFGTCSSLEEVRFKNLKIDVPFNTCVRISLASIAYMVENAANTAAITITLHATAYARCQADTTEYTYNEQTYVGILVYAAARNITIASA